MLGVVDLGVLNDAVGLEETIRGVAVVRSISGLREHSVPKLIDREIAACGRKVMERKVIVS